MRIVCISDTHVPRNLPPIPDGDVLIHAGDLTCTGSFQEIATAGAQLAVLPHKHKIVIAGNHDKLFEKDMNLAMGALGAGHNGIIYLQDAMGLLGPNDALIEVWGSPWTPRFYDWAFQLDRKRPESERPFLLKDGGLRDPVDHWKWVPKGIDILITHGPPYGVLDRTGHKEHKGDEALLDAVYRVCPRLHVFGHMHADPGVVELDGIWFVNAAMCDDAYRINRKPIVLDFEDGMVTLVTV